MHVNFELKFGANTIAEAKQTAVEEVSKFLEISDESVANSVDLELKVGIPDPEKDKTTHHFMVTAYGRVKNSIAKPI